MEKEIKFTLQLDENFIPEQIEWTANETGGESREKVKAMMVSVWDEKEKTAKKVDLWTKDMYVEEMKLFYFQTIMTMADGLERSTGERDMAIKMRKFGEQFGKELGILKS